MTHSATRAAFGLGVLTFALWQVLAACGGDPTDPPSPPDASAAVTPLGVPSDAGADAANPDSSPAQGETDAALDAPAGCTCHACPVADAAPSECPTLDASTGDPFTTFPLHPDAWGTHRAILVSDGDSIAAGYNVPTGFAYGSLVSLFLGSAVEYVQTAQSGARIDAQDPTFDLRVRPYLEAGVPAVVMTNAGTNDLAATEDAGGVWEHQAHYCQQVHDAGAKCVIVNILPRKVEALPGIRAELHAIQAAHWSEVADGLVDTWEDSRLMDAGDPVWFSDGLHPGPNGQLELFKNAMPVVAGALEDAGVSQ